MPDAATLALTTFVAPVSVAGFAAYLRRSESRAADLREQRAVIDSALNEAARARQAVSDFHTIWGEGVEQGGARHLDAAAEFRATLAGARAAGYRLAVRFGHDSPVEQSYERVLRALDKYRQLVKVDYEKGEHYNGGQAVKRSLDLDTATLGFLGEAYKLAKVERPRRRWRRRRSGPDDAAP